MGNNFAMLGLFIVICFVCGKCAHFCLFQGMRSATCITTLVIVSSLGHEVAARGLQLRITFASFVYICAFKCVSRVRLGGHKLQSSIVVCMYPTSIYPAGCSTTSMPSALAGYIEVGYMQIAMDDWSLWPSSRTRETHLQAHFC